MVLSTVSFTDADGGFGHYTTRYFPTKNIESENIFQLVRILNNEITKFLIKNCLSRIIRVTFFVWFQMIR